MKAYSIFNDLTEESINLLENNGIQLTILPKGQERPSGDALKKIIEEYDIVLISTAQKMPEEMFENITSPRIIASASIGIDHIHVPENKKDFIKIVNAPKSNRLSVAEHTLGLIIYLLKYMGVGNKVSSRGEKKTAIGYSPRELSGKTLGVIGGGGTATELIRIANLLGVKCLCYTNFVEMHGHLKPYVTFVDLETLFKESDIVSVNLPLTSETEGMVTKELIDSMKDDGIFVSVCRAELVDNKALFDRAKRDPNFRVALDLDADKVYGMWDDSMNNVVVTPHIAGGTVEARQKMFLEVAENIVAALK